MRGRWNSQICALIEALIMVIIGFLYVQIFLANLFENNFCKVKPLILWLIISDGRKPINLQCDEGTKFINATFKRLCRDQNINLYHDKKASFVERVLRTSKE